MPPRDCEGPFYIHEYITSIQEKGRKVMLLDFHATIEEQIAEGDLVVTRWSVQGTHQGMFRGHSPTGKQMSVTGIVIDRIVDGKAVEGWVEIDTLHQIQRLGVQPYLG